MAKDIVSDVQGKVMEVKVSAGDAVKSGQTIIIVQQTGKTEAKINSPADGTIESVKVKVGSEVSEGTVVAVLQ